MAHGFGGVREMDLPPFAEAMAAAGLTVLLFDYRFFGTSDGLPRQRLSPRSQLEDYRNAVSWLSTRPEVEPARIGAWGTSFSGAHMLHLAAFERRIKAVVTQVPAASALENAKRLMPPEVLAMVLDALAAERAAQYAGAAVSYLPISAPPGEFCALPDPGTHDTLVKAAAAAPSFRNEITLLSMEEVLEYAPAATAHLIDSTPVLMLLADRDTLTPVDLALEAFDAIRAPKKLTRFDVTHHDVYEEPTRTQAVTAAVQWFQEHL
jgi:fermentation-respiration switch protein FrsA (DUF1100 family)